MAFQVPIDLTWRNLFKASFLAIGDAALIAMIKDAPLSMHFAMVAASLIGFVALVKEDWLRKKHRWAFQCTLGISGAIFAGFVVFASFHAYRQSVITEKLEEFRGTGLSLEQRALNGMNSAEYENWQKQGLHWQQETSQYLQKNIGPVAEKRFLNIFARLSMNYGNNTPEFTHQMNLLVGQGQNLQQIIDGRSRPK